jgi:hypothetical protein
MKQKVIYSLKVVRQLLEMGFRPVETLDNPINSKYKCWVFARTPEFERALDEVLGGSANGRC